MRSLLAAVCAAVAAVPALATPITGEFSTIHSLSNRDDSTLSVNKDKDALTFEYTTSTAGDKNWIAVFNTGKGPEDGEKNEDSLTWDYAPEDSGELWVTADDLDFGSYDAYFLSDDGYESLAGPITVSVSAAPLHWIPSAGITLQNGRVGDKYINDFALLVGNLDGTAVEFSISSSENGDWASISKEGTLSGTPTADQTAKLTITASAANATADLDVSIPVVDADSPLVSELNVLTFNLWHGGTQVSNHHEKQIRFLAEANVDVVAVQEIDDDALRIMANALDWNYYQGEDSHDTGIASRYPFAEIYPEWSNGVAVRLDLGGKEVNVWGTHLGYDPYGPYDFCFSNMTKERVLEREAESGRTPQIKRGISNMQEQIDNADDVPVLLCGDFNAPSQLDWTDATASSHCGVGDFEWPSSKAPLDAGLTDAVRELYPDPVADPFITWSPVYKKNDAYGNRPEPMDRLDFVYYKGGLTPSSAEAVVRGDPVEQPNQQYNEWTTDHRAVRVTFDL